MAAFARGNTPPVVPGKVAAPAPSSAPCARISSFRPSGGFRPSSNNSIGAVWLSYDIQNCGTTDNSFQVGVTETVAGRPDLTFSWSPTVPIAASKTQHSRSTEQ